MWLVEISVARELVRCNNILKACYWGIGHSTKIYSKSWNSIEWTKRICTQVLNGQRILNDPATRTSIDIGGSDSNSRDISISALGVLSSLR
jgi:hypothetical protein